MCSLFGIIDYQNSLTDKQRAKIINVLARESTVRGTDATGIASLCKERLSIYKRPISAKHLRLRPPKGSRLILGHTRMTTQGSERNNYNNHPFKGYADGLGFALTHNGILMNDDMIKTQKGLPKTKIETDSYVAVQMIEQAKALHLQSLKEMVEQLHGTFTFALLDTLGSFYFVKGNNPLTLLHFEKGFYLYTSTDEIMKQALHKLHLQNMPYQRIKAQSGDIIRIDSHGGITRETFDDSALYVCSPFYGVPYWQAQNPSVSKNAANHPYQTSYIDDLKSFANTVGFDDKTIDLLLEHGWSTDEIEELLYCPDELAYYLDETTSLPYDWRCTR